MFSLRLAHADPDTRYTMANKAELSERLEELSDRLHAVEEKIGSSSRSGEGDQGPDDSALQFCAHVSQG